MSQTALATAVQPLWAMLRDYGEDPAPIFLGCGIEPGQLEIPAARLPVAACNALWLRVCSRIGDPSFGVRFGDYWHPTMFGPLGFAWLASSTLRLALERFARYTDLVLESGAVELIPQKDGALRVVLSYRGSAFTLPALADALLSLILRLCRVNIGDDLNPTVVTLFHSAPPDPGPFYSYFRCAIEFDADGDSLVLAGDVIDRPLPGRNPHLASLNEQEAVRYLAALDERRLVDRVRAAIVDQLASGNASAESVATALGLSTRSLRRQLSEEQTSFRELLKQTRHRLADAYLAQGRTNLTQLAFMLGFADPASFTRAYRSWTGKAPSRARS